MLPLQEAIMVSIQELDVIISFAVASDFRANMSNKPVFCPIVFLKKEGIPMNPHRGLSVRLEDAFWWLHQTHNANEEQYFSQCGDYNRLASSLW